MKFKDKYYKEKFNRDYTPVSDLISDIAEFESNLFGNLIEIDEQKAEKIRSHINNACDSLVQLKGILREIANESL